jgi:hypothetical protein
MQTNYSEQETERVRAAERDVNSAGMETQNLGQLPPSYAQSFAPQSTAPQSTLAAPFPGKNNLPALALVGFGIVLLLGQMLRGQLEIEGGMVLFTVASCLLFFSFWKRIYGLLIPGCILAGLSIGVTFADLTDGVSVMWGLSLGFLSILLLGRSLFGVRNSWPIYPAIPLFGVGVIIAAANAPAFLGAGLIWLPLALIGAGLFLGWGRRRV